jgi:chromosomal replication initiation ATPase DnaA
MKPNEVWQAALGELQLQMTRETFNTWLKPTRIISYEDGTLIVGVENGYVKEWLSNRLLATIQRTVTSIVGRTVEVKFVVWSKKNPTAKQPDLLHGLEPTPCGPKRTQLRNSPTCCTGWNQPKPRANRNRRPTAQHLLTCAIPLLHSSSGPAIAWPTRLRWL